MNDTSEFKAGDAVCTSSYTFLTDDGDFKKGDLFTIRPDGEIIKGENFTTQDAASLAFWDALAAMFPAWKEHLIKSAVVCG